MDAGHGDAYGLHDGEGGLYPQQVGVFILLPAEDEGVRVFFVFDDEIFDGGDAGHTSEVQFVVALLGVKAGSLAGHPAEVSTVTAEPLLLDDVLVFVEDSEVGVFVVAGGEVGFYGSGEVFDLGVLYECELFFVVLHNFGFVVLLPCVEHGEFVAEEAGFQFAQVADVVFGDVNFAGREDILGEALLLAGHDKLVVLLEVDLIGSVDETVLRALQPQEDGVVRPQLGVQELPKVGYLQQVLLLVFLHLQRALLLDEGARQTRPLLLVLVPHNAIDQFFIHGKVKTGSDVLAGGPLPYEVVLPGLR